MTKRMLIDATHDEETRVAVVDDSNNKLLEYDYENKFRKPLKGSIFLAKVTRVEPSLQAAFVNFGGNRHGFLPFSEIHPDYYRIPISDREALLAEQEAMLTEEMEREEAEDREEASQTDGAVVDNVTEDDDDMDEIEEIDNTINDLGDDEAETEEKPKSKARTRSRKSKNSEDNKSVDADDADDAKGNHDDSDSDDDDEDGEDDVNGNTEGSNEESGNGDDENRGNRNRRFRRNGRGGRGGRNGNNNNRRGGGRNAAHRSRQVEVLGGTEYEDEDGNASDRFRYNLRRQYKIQEVIKRGQIMLIQASREERGNKGAAVSTYLSLPGRYGVLMPNSPRAGGVSRKIAKFEDRQRMRETLKELDVPKGMSVILRTAGVTRTKAEIKRDVDYLMRLWDDIREKTLQSSAPALIYEEADLIKRAVRDLYGRDVDEIQVAGSEGYEGTKKFMKMMIPSHVKKVKEYKDDKVPLFHRFRIENQISEMSETTAKLKSGGYLVINPTEALVSIDVNSGRATKERHIEETALNTNLEAAEEVARQLRLRDLGGLVVIDFIDMEDRRNNARVERKLKEALSGDRARIQIGRISSFGLLELSRQRLNPSLTEAQYETCKHCDGRGVVRNCDSTSILLLRSLEEEGIKERAAQLIVHVSTEVAIYILNNKRKNLDEIESRYGFSVLLRTDDALGVDKFRIEVARPVEDYNPEDASQQAQDNERSERPERQERSERSEQASNDDEERGNNRRKRGRRGGRNRGGRNRGNDRRDDENQSDNNDNRNNNEQQNSQGGDSVADKGQKTAATQDENAKPNDEVKKPSRRAAASRTRKKPVDGEAVESNAKEPVANVADSSDTSTNSNAGSDAAASDKGAKSEKKVAAKKAPAKSRSTKKTDEKKSDGDTAPVASEVAEKKTPVKKTEKAPAKAAAAKTESKKKTEPAEKVEAKKPQDVSNDTAKESKKKEEPPPYEKVNEAPKAKKRGWWNKLVE